MATILIAVWFFLYAELMIALSDLEKKEKTALMLGVFIFMTVFYIAVVLICNHYGVAPWRE